MRQMFLVRLLKIRKYFPMSHKPFSMKNVSIWFALFGFLIYGFQEELKFREGLSVLSACHQVLLKYYQFEPKLSQEVRILNTFCAGMCTNHSSRTSHSFVPIELIVPLTFSKEDHILANVFDGMCYYLQLPHQIH